MALMGEVWPICKPGALVHFRFPHATTPFGIWRDPTHRRGVYLATFNYWDPSTFDGAYFGYYHPAKFEIVTRRLMYNMNTDTSCPAVATASSAASSTPWPTATTAGSTRERFWGRLLGIEECQIWMRALEKTFARQGR